MLRRFCTFLLLLIICLGQTAVVWAESGERKLPACCRRDGKHGCGMWKTAVGAEAGWESGVTRCDKYPVAKGFGAGPQVGVEGGGGWTAVGMVELGAGWGEQVDEARGGGVLRVRLRGPPAVT